MSWLRRRRRSEIETANGKPELYRTSFIVISVLSFNMQWTITLVIVSIVSSSHAYLDADGVGEFLGPLLKTWHRKCALILGVTDKDISDMQLGIFDDDNENVKRYPLCLRIVGDLLSTNLEINEELANKLPENLEKIKQYYRDCLLEAKNSYPDAKAYEIVWLMTKCLYKKDPENFVMY
ncbi:hypothetical protein JTB14_031376 [Gonioctena quinquepunctata]|nr:hypothetical protein JTB14_031376 [Gonioctena quinquepunctata]